MTENPEPLNDKVRRRMETQRTRDTDPELALRRELHRRGLRYRIHCAPLPDKRFKADIIFPRSRVAIFVDGCFWHSCPDHGVLPKHNRKWWAAKLRTNRDRDARIDAELRAEGWLPVRAWEHHDAVATAENIVNLLAERDSI